MTEFWKSGARHWCTYCKLFINGTKPSIAYHENGKKHKEIAELYLKEMRVRAREKGKDKKELEGELAKIERAALQQYQRDDVAGSSEARRPRDPEAGDRADRLKALEAWQHGRSLLARRSSEWAAWRGAAWHRRDRVAPVAPVASSGSPFSPQLMRPTHVPRGSPAQACSGPRLRRERRSTAARVPEGGCATLLPAQQRWSQIALPSTTQAQIEASKLLRSGVGPGGLPVGWRMQCNPDGAVYYEHIPTGVAQWEAPVGTQCATAEEPQDSEEAVPRGQRLGLGLG